MAVTWDFVTGSSPVGGVVYVSQVTTGQPDDSEVWGFFVFTQMLSKDHHPEMLLHPKLDVLGVSAYVSYFQRITVFT